MQIFSMLNQKKIVKKVPKMLKLITRNIAQNGNGQQRAIISGFLGPNLDQAHFDSIKNSIFWGIRPVIKGFNQEGNKLFKNNRAGKIKWFPNFNIPKLRRHVVFDIKPPRMKIQGFNPTIVNEKAVENTISKVTKLPDLKSLIADERIVVQGFGTTSSKVGTLTKKMDIGNTTERVVVKGFMA